MLFCELLFEALPEVSPEGPWEALGRSRGGSWSYFGVPKGAQRGSKSSPEGEKVASRMHPFFEVNASWRIFKNNEKTAIEAETQEA